MASTDFTGTGTAGTPQHLHKLRTDVPPASELAFPGCKPVRLPREELELYDGRLEFWDGATGTAWVCEPNSPLPREAGGRVAQPGGTHRPGTRLAHHLLRLDGPDGAQRGGACRGASCRRTSRCTCIPDGRGCRGRWRWRWGSTTCRTWCWRWTTPRTCTGGSCGCTRRGGSRRCGWRCRTIGRRADRSVGARGLTIHVLEDGVYRESPESRAFPGWSAEELHVAFNERVRSERTCEVLERVGSALGGAGGGRDRTTIRCCVPCAARAGRKAR